MKSTGENFSDFTILLLYKKAGIIHAPYLLRMSVCIVGKVPVNLKKENQDHASHCQNLHSEYLVIAKGIFFGLISTAT